jgi:hypothetical protein
VIAVASAADEQQVCRAAGRRDARFRETSIVRHRLAMPAMRAPERTHPTSKSLLRWTIWRRGAAPADDTLAFGREGELPRRS